jgi:hypothetical protein
MDVAQALQEVHASTTEVGAAIKSSSPLVAPPIEKRKSSFDKYSSRAMPPLVEDRSATIRGVNPEPLVQMEVRINAEVRAQERGSTDDILPVQQDDSFIEIRE